MLSHLKRRFGVLTAVAVLAALVPTLSMSPASAAASTTAVTRGDLATYSACPSGSASAAGFTDTTSTDVDCIAMYGITTGVTATTYEPSSSIPRWQMALYLTRFLNEAGYTLGSGADQGFTDISGYAADIQTAINQLKQSGVTTGTTATTYSPDDNVTREQMAMFIERALGKITAGPGGQSDGGTVVNGSSSTAYTYTDIDTSVTFEGHNAIVELLHLGVTGDTGAVGETYRPSENITRAEMATFLTNAAAHTNLRPAGVTIQSSATTGFGAIDNALHISHRDANFDAVPGTLIDVFSDLTAAETDPFSSTGACNTANTDVEGGVTECAINVGDASTDASGNADMLAAAVTDTAAATTRTYWAWTGAVGATYNNSTAPGSSVAVTSSAAATVTTVSNTISTNNSNDSDDGGELVSFGQTVTFTGQLQTATGGTNVAMAGSATTVTDQTIQGADDGAGLDGDGVAGDDVIVSTTTTSLTTDANGSWTYSVTQADPSALTANNLIQTSLTFATAIGANTNVLITWNDNPSVASKVTVVNNSDYGVGAATGVSRTATATVYDQYGVGMSGQSVGFDTSRSPTATASFAAATRTTNSSGVATLGFTDVQTTSTGESVHAYAGALVATPDVFYRISGAGADAESVDKGTSGVSDQAGDVLLSVVVNDAANDTLVVRNDSNGAAVTFASYAYRSTDQFTKFTAPSTNVATTMADFETQMAANMLLGGQATAVVLIDVTTLSTGIQRWTIMD